jgi:uncharacterized protein YndB with AHSA1/START domain
METISVSMFVQRPVEDVFAFVTDARNNPLWQSNAGLQGTRQMPEDVIGVGTRIVETWQFVGRANESIGEVTTYEPNRTYTRHLIGGSSPIKEGTYTFEPAAEGVRWIFTAQVHTSGHFAIAEPLLASMLKRGMEASMSEAKALLERPVAERAR